MPGNVAGSPNIRTPTCGQTWWPRPALFGPPCTPHERCGRHFHAGAWERWQSLAPCGLPTSGPLRFGDAMPKQAKKPTPIFLLVGPQTCSRRNTVLHCKNGAYIGKNLIFSLNRQLFSMARKNNKAEGEVTPPLKKGVRGFLSRTGYAILSAAFRA